MARCYQCDMCGVVTILKGFDEDSCEFEEPSMSIYYKKNTFDICPNCAKKVVDFVTKNAASNIRKKVSE